MVIYRLHKSDLPQRYPKACAELILYLSDFEVPSYSLHGIDRVARTLLQRDLPIAMQDKLKALLLRLGFGLVENAQPGMGAEHTNGEATNI